MERSIEIRNRGWHRIDNTYFYRFYPSYLQKSFYFSITDLCKVFDVCLVEGEILSDIGKFNPRLQAWGVAECITFLDAKLSSKPSDTTFKVENGIMAINFVIDAFIHKESGPSIPLHWEFDAMENAESDKLIRDELLIPMMAILGQFDDSKNEMVIKPFDPKVNFPNLEFSPFLMKHFKNYFETTQPVIQAPSQEIDDHPVRGNEPETPKEYTEKESEKKRKAEIENAVEAKKQKLPDKNIKKNLKKKF